MYPYKLTHNSKICVPKVTKSFIFFYKKDLSQNNRHRVTESAYTVPAGWSLDLNRCVQRTIKVLIRLDGCTGWSASLLFTYDTNRFFHDVAHFQINRSYLCRIRRKRICCIQFYGETSNCWFTIVGVIFCRGFIENKFAMTRSIVRVRKCTMRLFM